MIAGRTPGIILLLGALVSGSAQQAKAPADTAQAQANAQAAAAPENYVIGAQDVLNVNVWREPELTESVPVRPDGKISIPLLNDVQAAGLTPLQLSQQITDGLKKYVATPQVTVEVSAINSKRIYVMGQVLRAGAYPMLPNMTVLQALSSAGGFTQFAKSKKIYVMRKENGQVRKFEFNYKQAIRGEHMEQDIALSPGDTIVVP